jgi:hypothetical protein
MKKPAVTRLTIDATLLLEELEDWAWAQDQCPACHAARGCSHEGDCLIRRIRPVASALAQLIEGEG